MALRDDGDGEIVNYLEFLMEHAKTCGAAVCPVCDSLASVCDLVTNLLFTNECYGEVGIAETTRHAAVRTSAQRS